MTRTYQDTFDSYPIAWRSLILELEQEQMQLRADRALENDWGDKTFTAGSDLPASTWNMLKSGKHPAPTLARGEQSMTLKLQSLQDAVREIRLRISNSALLNVQKPLLLPGFVEDVNCTALVAALKKCEERARESSEERLIVLRAATGEGKTWLRKWAHQKGHVHYVVSARPSWKRNYAAFLRALAGVLNLDIGSVRGVARLEADIIDKAQTLHGVVWFEEVQRLSTMAQEFLKLLLNEAHLTLIIALTPEAYTHMRHSADGDTLQLFRRAACNMELSKADASFLNSSAPDLWTRAHDPACQQRLITEAERFGGRALIADVHRRLRLKVKPGSVITLADVEDCLSAYRANVPDLASSRRAFGQRVEGRAA